MEIRHLRHFVAVVETGNLSRACERVHISQPALTRSIQSLEAVVGSRLIDRLPRGVAPTPAGKRLYDHALFILNECARARSEVRAIGAGGGDRVSIGFAAMFADHVVDRAVAEVCAELPHAHVSARLGFWEELVDDLSQGALDLVFCNKPGGGLSSDLVFEPLLDITARVFCNVDHPLAQKDQPTREDLAAARWIVVDQTHARENHDAMFAETAASPEPVVVTNSLNMIRALLAQDDFLALLPEHLMRAQVASGVLTALDVPGFVVQRKSGLMYRAGAPRAAATDRLVAHIRKICARGVPGDGPLSINHTALAS